MPESKSVAQLLTDTIATNVNFHAKNIGDSEAIEIAEILKVKQSLKVLKLSGNSIGYIGAKALAEALKVNMWLEVIDLRGNNIDDAGAAALAEALKVNENLIIIDLSLNNIGNDGTSALAEVSRVNRSLTDIYLHGNNANADLLRTLDNPVIKMDQPHWDLRIDWQIVNPAGEGEVENVGVEDVEQDVQERMAARDKNVQGEDMEKELSHRDLEGLEYKNGANDIAREGVLIHFVTEVSEDEHIENAEESSEEEDESSEPDHEQLTLLNEEIIMAKSLNTSPLSPLRSLQSLPPLPPSARSASASAVMGYGEEEKAPFADHNSSFSRAHRQSFSKPLEGGTPKTPAFRPATSKTTIDPLVLDEIRALVTEGYDKMKEMTEKAIVLLGFTGAGKSTFANVLTNQKLQAIRDEEINRLIIDAFEPGHNTLDPKQIEIPIGHNGSETKIPNKGYADDGTAVIDCPGFKDNGYPAQRIANSFYIERVLKTTKSLKFVLLVTEASIIDGRGREFIDSVNQLNNTFTDSSVIKGSVSLVVTHASPDSNLKNIVAGIKRAETNNRSLTPEVSGMIESLLQSVHIFHRPTAEGPLEIEYDFLKEINLTTRYTSDNISEYACVLMSEKEKDYVSEVLKYAQETFIKIANIVLRATAETKGYIVDDKALDNDVIILKDLLPELMTYDPFGRLPEHKANEHFINIAVLSRLHEAVNSNADNSEDSILRFLSVVLEIFEEYVSSPDNTEGLKKQMQQYSYTLNQQMEYIKFYSQIGSSKADYLNDLISEIYQCKLAVSHNLENSIKSLNIQDGQNWQYYQDALKYLEMSNDKEWSTKAQATTHIKLGDTYADDRGYNNMALKCYIKAMNLDPKLRLAYEKTGDFFYKVSLYEQAIKCYATINDHHKMSLCFNDLLKSKPQDAEVHNRVADFWASIGLDQDAMKLYYKSSSLSGALEFKTAITQKIREVLSDNHRLEVATKLALIVAGNFWNFEAVNPAELLQEFVTVNNDTIDAELLQAASIRESMEGASEVPRKAVNEIEGLLEVHGQEGDSAMATAGETADEGWEIDHA